MNDIKAFEDFAEEHRAIRRENRRSTLKDTFERVVSCPACEKQMTFRLKNDDPHATTEESLTGVSGEVGTCEEA